MKSKILLFIMLVSPTTATANRQAIKQQTIDSIIQVCDEYDIAEPHVLLAIADIETGGKFNNKLLRSQTGTYKGIYQIKNRYTMLRDSNGCWTNYCRDDARFSIEKSTLAV